MGRVPLHDTGFRGFASDNNSGIAREILAAITAANGGHQIGYGGDAYTERLQDVIRAHFGDAATAYPVFNGTGANVVALQAACDRWGSVICSEHAHIHVDEGGAPEKMAGLKLLPVPAAHGTLTVDLEVTHPVEANAVFAALPEPARRELQERFLFYDWDEAAGEVRWMTSFDTTAEDVDRFATAVAEALGR
jgi:threonine aldolase